MAQLNSLFGLQLGTGCPFLNS